MHWEKLVLEFIFSFDISCRPVTLVKKDLLSIPGYKFICLVGFRLFGTILLSLDSYFLILSLFFVANNSLQRHMLSSTNFIERA